ncbi:MAG: hypothetical protein M3Q08_18195 [Pseudomonadota bacterium]|nr:hypothetical protein [Chloroflexota bacterium]MDP9415976.1 hypothetical protein [Pseudomonadota bacterium]
MGVLLVLLVVFVIVLVLLLGLSIGVAFLLDWLLPTVGLEMALLVAVIAVGQAILIFGRMMNTPPASPDPEGESAPPIVILDRELALPRRRRKRT